MTKIADVGPEFIGEAQEIVDTLNRDLIAVEKESRTGDADPDRVNSMFRSAHSLKGVSGMFGLEAISSLAHDLENVLDSMRLGKVKIDASGLDVLFACVERFGELLDAVGEGEERGRAAVVDLLERLEVVAGARPGKDVADPLSLVDISEDILSVLTEYEEHRLRENVRKGRALFILRTSFDLADFDVGLAEIDGVVKSVGEVITKLPSAEAGQQGQISFDILVGSTEPAETLEGSLADERIEIIPIHSLASVPSEVQPVAEPAPVSGPEAVDEQPVLEAEVALDDDPVAGVGENQSVRRVSQTVRVDIRRLDQLMNLVGELALSKAAINRISDQMKREYGFTGLAVDLHKESRSFQLRLGELQAGIMDVRMVPLANLFERMVRAGRKTGRELGREVRLDVSGGHTELDKLIVEDLADPLMHLIRNAIDHGLESPEERVASGKPREGVVELSAAAQGNHVIVRVSDDGAGINVERTLKTALGKGLVTADRASEMSEREVFNLLFLPGFSTRDGVSEYSGRGVGLDVVKTNISRLSGVIEVDSTPGKGTTVIITLPITLAIIPALIVSIGDTPYALPLNNVQETLAIERGQIRTIERREVITLRGATVPLLDLREVFDLAPADTEGITYGVVVGLGVTRMALLVDELVGQQDIVIKSLGRRLRRVRGIAGATELGDQRTILVIDTVDLLTEMSSEGGARVGQ